MVSLYVETRQDRANSSLPGSFPGVGGANPPPATSLIVRGPSDHFFLLGGKVMIEAICIGIKSCLYAVGFGMPALIVTSFLKECSNIWKNK